MKNKSKDLAVALVLAVCLIGFFAACLFHSPVEISRSERRKLGQMPALTARTALSEEFYDAFSTYAVDQFPLREKFRTLQAMASRYLYLQRDNNRIYQADGYVSKLEYPMKRTSVAYCASHANAFYERYLAGTDVRTYYTVVPDKNFFLAKQNGYPAMDYDAFLALYTGSMDENMTYIPIFDCLEIEDYYVTDTHWQQQRLGKVVEKISTAIGCRERLGGAYTEKTLAPFYGVYCGQSALTLPPDTITYCTNETLEACTVQNFEQNCTSPVYDTARFTEDLDAYNIFLSGPCSMLTVTNPNATTDKELVIIRDSFGSSLAPLLVEAYRKVTLLDLRYMTTEAVGDVLTFTDQDVLFVYNVSLINNSTLLK